MEAPLMEAPLMEAPRFRANFPRIFRELISGRENFGTAAFLRREHDSSNMLNDIGVYWCQFFKPHEKLKRKPLPTPNSAGKSHCLPRLHIRAWTRCEISMPGFQGFAFFIKQCFKIRSKSRARLDSAVLDTARLEGGNTIINFSHLVRICEFSTLKTAEFSLRAFLGGGGATERPPAVPYRSCVYPQLFGRNST